MTTTYSPNLNLALQGTGNGGLELIGNEANARVAGDLFPS